MPRQLNSFFPQTNFRRVDIAALVVIAMLWISWTSTRAEPRKIASTVSASQSASAYKQRIRVWIHGDSVRPRIVQARPGVVLLTCENKTLLNGEVVVARVLPNQIIQALAVLPISAQRGRGTQEFLLAEGEYVIYERSRPELKATLLVRP